MPQYVEISIADFFPDKPVPFDVYSRPGGRKDPRLFLKAGSSVPAERIESLAENENLTFFLDVSALPAYKNYFSERAKEMDAGISDEQIDDGVAAVFLGKRETGGESAVFAGFSLRVMIFSSAVFALFEMYANASESSALVLGGVFAYAVFALAVFLTKQAGASEKNMEQAELKEEKQEQAPEEQVEANAPEDVAAAGDAA